MGREVWWRRVARGRRWHGKGQSQAREETGESHTHGTTRDYSPHLVVGWSVLADAGTPRLAPEETEPTATPGTVDTLLKAYHRWTATATQYDTERNLVLSLRYPRGLSAAFTKAKRL